MAEQNGKARPMPAGRRGRGPVPPGGGVEHPGEILKRIFSYVMQSYRLHCIVVLVCIILSAFCNVQGTNVYADSD